MVTSEETRRAEIGELQTARKLLTLESALIPIHLIPEAKIDAIREAAISRLLITAHKGLGSSKLIIRDLFPTDLGLTNETWFELTGASANVYEDSAIASATIADATFVCIWGVTDNSAVPSVAALKFKVGASEIARWHLDKLNNLEHRVAIALSPIIVSQNMDFTIQHYVKLTNSGTDIVFDGVVCEKEGITIRP